MEGQLERPWRTTRTWRSLLGHLCPSSDLANCTPLPYPFHSAWLAKSPTRLRDGLSSGPSRNASLYEAAARLQAQRDHKEDARTQTPTQCIWPKTSRTSVEQVYGPWDAGDRVQTKPV